MRPKIDKIEDTYAEAFEGIYSRVIVTADDRATLRNAVNDATATPSVVIGRLEGGVEKWIGKKETPDKRVGAILQFWGELNKSKSFADVLKKFEAELSYRIRQDILVKPFTAIYDALPNPAGQIDMMERVGHCGDGLEWVEKRHGREVIVVPLMVPNFIIERHIGFARGVSGGNFWIMCRTKKALREAGKKALDAIHKVNGVITPFDICSAGSKTETRFPLIGPTTNHPYCPSLREKLKGDSKVPQGIRYIPEVVVNGVSIGAVENALKAGIKAVLEVEGVDRVSSGNYDGTLGEFKINLRGLIL
jgi:formylmethanofuran--tetrahydromethanopterin N-formyltransferase